MVREEIHSGHEDGSCTPREEDLPPDHLVASGRAPQLEADLVLDEDAGSAGSSGAARAVPPPNLASSAPAPGRLHHPRTRLVTTLAACLAASLALVLVLTGMLVTSAVTSGDRAAVNELIEDYSRAVTAHDLVAVRATLMQHAVFAAGEGPDRPTIGPVRGVQLDEMLEGLFRASLSLSTTGRVEITGDGPYQVTAQQTVTYVSNGVAVHEEGVSLYSVVLFDDRPRIARHIWWRPLDSSGPALPALVTG